VNGGIYGKAKRWIFSPLGLVIPGGMHGKAWRVCLVVGSSIVAIMLQLLELPVS
jgi:hypothetical protein